MSSDRIKIFRDDGEAFQRWGNLDEAERCYLKALDSAAGNRDHLTLYRMAELFLEKKEPQLALGYHLLAVNADRDNLLYKQRFLDVAGTMRLERYNADVEDVLLQCLRTSGLDFSNAGPLWSTLLKNNPVFAPLYSDRQLFEKKFDPAPLLRPYFIEGLKKILVYDLGFEDFVRRLRLWLLMGLPSRPPLPSGDYLRLAEAVADYCFYGGFIIRMTTAEEAKLRDLSCQPDPLSAAVRACYGLEDVPLSRSRWRAAPVQTLEAKLFFPQRKEKLERTFAGTRPELLVAGCGTGREAILTALYYPKGNITAIDASGENIAYASQKGRDYNVQNISFRQDDISTLAKIPKPYDIIYSDILHYLPEPLKAWQILWDNLKPAGIMKISLAGQAPMQPALAARAVIQKFNIGNNRESVIDFRARSPDLLPSETLAELADLPEYYSLSSYNDLLFRPGIRYFTLPEIEETLAQLHLLFEGFDLPASVLQRYGEKFPDDPEMISLKNWHIFEQEAPQTFSGLYRFWCRKF